MGRQLVNDLGKDSRSRGIQSDAYYLTFLQKALQEKQPGLDNLILTSDHPSQYVLDAFPKPMGSSLAQCPVAPCVNAFRAKISVEEN